MIVIIEYILAFLFAIGVLITFHEYGHFVVARFFDVKILRFSIGFGKPLWKRYIGKDKTELVIAALPLGGYVKMLDEREAPVDPSELPRSFNQKSLYQRFFIVLAGPFFNFIFAVLAYWLMFMIGLTGLKPEIGNIAEDSIAARAGLQTGQEIIAIDDLQTKTWAMVMDVLIKKIVSGEPVELTVRKPSGQQSSHRITLENISVDDISEQGILTKLGIKTKEIQIPAIIGSIQKGLPADTAGFKPGDKIKQVNGQEISDWREWVDHIRQNHDQEISVEIYRDGFIQTLLLTPQKKILDDGQIIGFIGAGNQPPADVFARESYTLFPAFIKALQKTWDMSLLTLRVMGKIITGQASYRNLSGPISIAQYAGESAQGGVAPFLWFLGIVSVSLGILNLLPIPLLDGGHLFYYIIEFVKGSPVSESFQLLGQQIGLALLICLMILVFYNDITRLAG